MTKEEILFLYKAAYKEAADYRPGLSADQSAQRRDLNWERDFSKAMSGLADKQREWAVQRDFDNVFRRMSSAPSVSNNPTGWARQALAQVYGQNHLNSLDDNAYVQRRWNAAMRGSRANQLMSAYQQAYRTGNGMTAGAGMFYGGNQNLARLGMSYGVGNPYQRPTLARPQPRWTPTTLPDRHYDRNNPVATANRQWQANRQAMKQQNQRYRSLGVIPNGMKKEFGI